MLINIVLVISFHYVIRLSCATNPFDISEDENQAFYLDER